MILPIYTYGQPVLRKVAKDIPTDYEGLESFIQDMYDTLADSEGIGLAAPQVGKDIRVVVIDLDVISDDLPEYKGYKKAFINPHIVEADDNFLPPDNYQEQPPVGLAHRTSPTNIGLALVSDSVRCFPLLRGSRNKRSIPAVL